MYNENLTDRTQCILFQNLGSTKLSDASIDAIRTLFPKWINLYDYIIANVEMSRLERWDVIFKIYPEQI